MDTVGWLGSVLDTRVPGHVTTAHGVLEWLDMAIAPDRLTAAWTAYQHSHTPRDLPRTCDCEILWVIVRYCGLLWVIVRYWIGSLTLTTTHSIDSIDSDSTD